MTVVESAASELSAAQRGTRRRIDGALVVSVIVVLQLAWLGAIAYGAYRLMS
jgi:hypothetical protein